MLELLPFGELLKTFRRRQRLSQQALAEQMGVHRNTIGSWEQGNYLPDSKGSVLELAFQLNLSEAETRQLLEASLTGISTHWSVFSRRNPFFTGREHLLRQLHEQLSSGKDVALTPSSALYGLGGIGKTQTALEYAYRYAQHYSAVFWIDAEGDENIHASFLRIANQLGLAVSQMAETLQVISAVQRWLASHHGWLLIWDNVEDLELVQRWLPPTRQGALLFTTRRQALGALAQGIELSTMTEEEGVLLLLRRAKVLPPEASDEHVHQLRHRQTPTFLAAQALVAALGGLPLALDQAGAYVEETPCRLEEYWELYQVRRAELLKRRGDTALDHPASVVTTWSLAFEQVARTNAAAADLLRVCAFLYAEAIPEELFRDGAAALGEQLGLVAADVFLLHDVFRAVSAYSLVKRNLGEHTLSIHRLVQAVLWEEMGDQERQVWQRRAIRALDTAFPEIIPENWKQCERFLPHLLACVATLPEDVLDPDLAVVLRKTADYLRGRARFKQAEPLYQRALHIEEQLWGPEHPRLAAPLYGLALLLYEQGRYVQAEPLARRALCIWEHALPPEKPDLAHPLIGLAAVLFGQGKYAQVETLCQRALRLREQALGSEHSQLISPLTDLAEAYNEQGNYAQAEPLYQRAIRIQEQILSAEHPLMAYALCGLGRLYSRQGKDEQAEALYRQALHVREHTLGLEHPYLAEPLTGLAVIAARQGKNEQAEALYQQALRVGEHTWGPGHPELVPPLLNLADLYAGQGKDEQAATLYQRVQGIWEQNVRIEHPLLAVALSGLASLAMKQGRVEEAEALYQRALSMQERLLGPDHPDRARSMADLARLYCKQGNYTQAKSLFQCALAIFEHSLGSRHPDTVNTQRDYTFCLEAL